MDVLLLEYSSAEFCGRHRHHHSIALTKTTDNRQNTKTRIFDILKIIFKIRLNFEKNNKLKVKPDRQRGHT